MEKRHNLLKRKDRIFIVHLLYSCMIKNQKFTDIKDTDMDEIHDMADEMENREIDKENIHTVISKIENNRQKYTEILDQWLVAAKNTTSNLYYLRYIILLLFLCEIDNYFSYLKEELKEKYSEGFFIAEHLNVISLFEADEKERTFLHVLMDNILKKQKNAC